jgi:YVTN family beta-propeller protein
MTLRKIRHAILILIAAAAPAHAGTTAYISTFGQWPLCVNGALGGIPGLLASDCSWYAPGAETYSLNVRTDSAATRAYAWEVTAVLKDGSTKTVEGIAPRKDDKTTGYTEIPKVVFGGIVVRILSIRITESVAPIAWVPAGSSGVSVIDTATNTVTATIPTTFPAWAIAITPDGKFAYISESAADGSGARVEVIATATNTAVANIPLSSGAAGIAVSPNGQSVYVCNRSGNSVSVIATATNSVVAQIPTGLRPTSIVFSPDGSSAWVANPDSNTVSMIDTATNTVANTLSSVGSYPYDLAVAPTGSVVFVSGAEGVFAIDIATGGIAASISMPGSPAGLAVSADGALLYRTYSNNGGSYLSVVETSGYTVVTTIGTAIAGQPGDLSVSPDGAFLYLSNSGPTVSVVSTATYALLSSFSVPTPPGNVIFAPSSNAAIAPALVTVHPASVAGGTPATGYVVLNGAAPAGGATVPISSDDSAAAVPASVTVPAGGKTASFNVTTQPVSASRPVNISAVYGALSKSAVLTVIPAAAATISSVSVNPTTVLGGDATTGTVALTAPAPAGGVAVELWTNGWPAFVPESVTIPAGSAMGTFHVTTNFVTSTTQGTITAFLNGTSVTTTVTVTSLPAVVSVSVVPGTVPDSGSALGTVTLSGPAPTGGIVVQLWTNGWPVFVPASVTVLAGSTSATFTAETTHVTTTAQGTITAFLNGESVTTTLTVAPPALASVSVAGPTAVGGTAAQGTVTLTSPAPTGGVVVWLWTNGSPGYVNQASITIASGSTTGYFDFETDVVDTSRVSTITAFLNGQTVSTSVTVLPLITPASVTVSPRIVRGSGSATGTVTLSARAPNGGILVWLWTNGSPAFVPETVIVPSGAVTVTFPVTTSKVTTSTQGTITAFLNGKSVTTTITVRP